MGECKLMICKYCEKEFEAVSANQKYCSKECKIEFNNKVDICSKCGLQVKIKIKNKKICYNCYNNSNRIECFVCGKNRNISTRNEEGFPLCSSCRSELKKEYCSICNTKKKVDKRLENGDPVCSYCSAKMRTELCSVCNKNKIVNTRLENGDVLCHNCACTLNKKVCSICHIEKRINGKTENGDPICVNCSSVLNQKICSICNKKGRVGTKNINGDPICIYCADKLKKEYCFICNKYNRVSSRLENGDPVCGNCQNLRKVFDNNIEKIKKYIKSNKSLHHIVFEGLYPHYISEYSISKLLDTNIFINNNYNKLLRYDYYNIENNILIELNEPCHYSLSNFLTRFSNKTEEDFNKYITNFDEKIRYAKENNVKLIIIDVNYNMSWKELENLYAEKI